MGFQRSCFSIVLWFYGAFADQRSFGRSLRIYSREHRKNRLVALVALLDFSSLILFYAAFKTVTSIEDDKEVRKWSKYWIFYGLASFFCNLLNTGDLPMIVICGVLLFKFNVFSFGGRLMYRTI